MFMIFIIHTQILPFSKEVTQIRGNAHELVTSSLIPNRLVNLLSLRTYFAYMKQPNTL